MTQSRYELVKLIEAKQDEIVQLHCGPKHSRGNQYTRGSSCKKKLITPPFDPPFSISNKNKKPFPL